MPGAAPGRRRLQRLAAAAATLTLLLVAQAAAPAAAAQRPTKPKPTLYGLDVSPAVGRNVDRRVVVSARRSGVALMVVRNHTSWSAAAHRRLVRLARAAGLRLVEPMMAPGTSGQQARLRSACAAKRQVVNRCAVTVRTQEQARRWLRSGRVDFVVRRFRSPATFRHVRPQASPRTSLIVTVDSRSTKKVAHWRNAVTAAPGGTRATLALAPRGSEWRRSLASYLTLVRGATARQPPTSKRNPPKADTLAPTQPTNLRMTANGLNFITMKWDASQDNVAVVRYDLYLDGKSQGSTSYPEATWRGLSCGTTFRIEVEAVDAKGNRSPRATAYAGTMWGCRKASEPAPAPAPEPAPPPDEPTPAPADTTAPTAPSGLTQTSTTQTGARLTCGTSSDDVGVAGYGVYSGGLLVGTTTSTWFEFSGLTCNTDYAVSVDAFDGAGNRSSQSAFVISTADCDVAPPPSEPPPPADSTAPTVPSGLAVSGQTQTSLTLGWDASSDDTGVTGYGLYRNGTSVGSTGATTRTYSFTGLTCGTSYTLAVDAVDAAGNRSARATVNAATSACSPPSDSTPPTAPGALAIGSSTQTSVSFTWGASTDNVGVTGYGVYRAGTLVASTSSTNHAATGLTCGTSYLFAVDAVDAAGNRSTKTSATLATLPCADTTPPSAPTGFVQTASSETSVMFTWQAATDNVGVTGYGVYQNGLLLASTATTAFSKTGLTCGADYTFEVDAVDGAGNRSTKATFVARTSACPDTSPPTKPASLTQTGSTTTSVSLSWGASTDNVGVVGYRVLVNGAVVGTPSGTTFTASGLACGTSYTFAVDAVDAAGNRSAQAVATMATAACPPPPPTEDTQPPTAPGNPVVSAMTGTSLTLAWSPSTDNVGVTGYGVYRDGTRVATPTTTSYTFTGLACGTTYRVAVDAVDAAGNRSAQSSVSATLPACPDATPPSAPASLLLAGRTVNTISVTWSASTDNVGVAGYDLFRDGTKVGTATSTSYTFGGLACATGYTLSVVAFDAAGNRSPATAALYRTSDCPDTQAPSVPSGLTVTGQTETSLTLTWNAATDNVAVTGYGVYRGSTLVGSTSASTRTYTVTGLACGTSYSVGVDAVDAAGNRSARASLAGTTAACPPPPSSGEPTPIAGQGYRQVFRDDFSTLNRAVWDDHIWYDETPPSSWTGFQEVDASGILHLRTSRNFISAESGQPYPINTITTLSSGRTFTLGYFEARMKWSAGRGSWPGFWLYSYRHATNPAWPSVNPFCSQNGLSVALCYSAEIDVFEGQGSEPNVFYGTIHRNSCNCYGVSNQQNSNNYRPVASDLTAGFHTYGLLWTSTEVRWYLDGQFLHSAPVYDSTNQPMFLLLQEWVGGWTYEPDSSTPTVIENQIDYVSVWQK